MPYSGAAIKLVIVIRRALGALALARSARSLWQSDELCVGRNFRNRCVADGDVRKACLFEFFLQDGGTHGTGAHAGIAGEDDVGDML